MSRIGHGHALNVLLSRAFRGLILPAHTGIHIPVLRPAASADAGSEDAPASAPQARGGAPANLEAFVTPSAPCWPDRQPLAWEPGSRSQGWGAGFTEPPESILVF